MIFPGEEPQPFIQRRLQDVAIHWTPRSPQVRQRGRTCSSFVDFCGSSKKRRSFAGQTCRGATYSWNRVCRGSDTVPTWRLPSDSPTRLLHPVVLRDKAYEVQVVFYSEKASLAMLTGATCPCTMYAAMHGAWKRDVCSVRLIRPSAFFRRWMIKDAAFPLNEQTSHTATGEISRSERSPLTHTSIAAAQDVQHLVDQNACECAKVFVALACPRGL